MPVMCLKHYKQTIRAGNMKNDTKQVIVIRKDLKMRKGKMVSQGSHASGKVFFDRGSIITNEGGTRVLCIPLTDGMEEWVENIFTKIVCSVNSLEELIELFDLARKLDIPCSLIQDVGLTEFNGVPTYTAIAVGPAKNEDVDKVTKGLPLL